MSMQASTDRDLARAGARQRQIATRLLGAGLGLVGAGLLLLVAFTADTVEHVGVVLAFLGLLPVLAGTALLLSGLVSRRASRHQPFA